MSWTQHWHLWHWCLHVVVAVIPHQEFHGFFHERSEPHTISPEVSSCKFCAHKPIQRVLLSPDSSWYLH